MRIVGIDPGQSGAVALYDTDKGVVYEPLILDNGVLEQLDAHREIDAVVLERQCPRRGQSSAADWTRAENYGALKVYVTMYVENQFAKLYTPMPHNWKRQLGLAPSDDPKVKKARALELAKSTWPTETFLRTPRSRVPDHNVAEACLLALWGSRVCQGLIKIGKK